MKNGFSVENIKPDEIISIKQAEYSNIITIDGILNTLTYHPLQQDIGLNESQKRLFYCMLMNVTRKTSIIMAVWNENHKRISDNNYHQLIFQTRALLKRHGLPGTLLITVPYYGIRFNTKLLEEIARRDRNTLRSTLTPA